DLGKIRGADMEAWLPRMRNPRNALLAIVGKVSRHEGEQLARKWFGSWKGLPEALPFALPAVPPPRKTIGIEGRPIIVNRDGGDAQVLLALACRLPAAQHGSRATYQLLASALNGHLNTMVRYRAGAAYSVSSQVNFRSGGAADLWVTMDLETRRLSEALAAVRTLWTRLGNEGFDPGTVSQARWALATGSNLRYGTSAEVVLSVLENWSLGWPVNGLATYPTELRNSKPEDLTGPFRTCRESTVSLVLGEKAVVEGALAAQR
ncbi:MAG TPA: insulinase family protein, partial [Polyangia bacterium]